MALFSSRKTIDAEAIIQRLLREIVPWQLAKKDITPEMSLHGELGIDSLRKMALAFRLEEEAGVDLTQFTGDLADLQTVQDLIGAAEELIVRSESV